MKPNPPKMLTAAQIKAVFGGRSDRTLRRWRDLKGFPKPQVILGRNFYPEAAVHDWMSAQMAKGRAA